MPRKARNVSNLGNALDLKSMETWTGLIKKLDSEMNPKSRHLDEDEALEVATMFVESGKYLVKHAHEFGRICNKDDDKTVSISLSCQLDRSNHPAQVSVRIGFSEKYSDGRKVIVPDSKQTELPLEAGSNPDPGED